MIRTLLPARRGAVLVLVACALALFVPPALAQGAANISVNPNSGPPGSQFTITLNNFHACAADKPSCIVIDFVQSGKATRIGTADSKGSPTFTGGPLTVPPSATAGSAIVHAFSDTDDAQTAFTVTNAPPPTTTVPGATTSSSSTSTSSSSTTVTTVVPVLTEPPTTTTTIASKKASSHSDVPRYIAVVLVVLAAAATAAVDTRMRRLNPPTGGP